MMREMNSGVVGVQLIRQLQRGYLSTKTVQDDTYSPEGTLTYMRDSSIHMALFVPGGMYGTSLHFSVVINISRLNEYLWENIQG